MRLPPPKTFVLLLLLVAPCQGCAHDRSQATNEGGKGGGRRTFPDAQSAAAHSLETLRALVNEQNFRELGFESSNEAARAALGRPLPVFFVRLDRLRQYNGTDPSALLDDQHQLNFPVTVGEQTRSSVVVERVDGAWKVASLGNGALAKLLATYRPPAPVVPQGQAQEQFLVHVGALGLYFLGDRSTEKLRLTPLVTEPELKLQAGTAMPAEEVFTLLVPLAKAQGDAPA